MFEVIRVRLAVREDGRVLALLGAEVRGPGGVKVETRREGMTAEAWDAGLWLRPGDLA
jgi:hypothetical protein